MHRSKIASRSSVPECPPSSSAPRMFFIMKAQPVHSIIVLWVSHDGVDVIGLLNSELDDQPRSMNPIVEGAAEIVSRPAP